MEDYRALERMPVHGSYRGYDIVAMPPPSSGGIALIETVEHSRILSARQGRPDAPETLHLMAEAMKPVYADRATYLGDPDRVKIPVSGLISKLYAARLRAEISPDKARPASDIKPGNPLPYEDQQTTHFSIVDSEGNAVSNTYTLNFAFGVGLVAQGTGILLNNELDDFAAKPGAPNAYGLVGGAANAPAGGKRPLSSMTPAMVFRDGKLQLVTGSPGGSRIITIVAEILLDCLDFHMNVAEAEAARRIHDQWLPDELQVEPGFPQATLQKLAAMGHKIKEYPPWGSAQSIIRHGRSLGRGIGSAPARWAGGGVLTVSSCRPCAGHPRRRARPHRVDGRAAGHDGFFTPPPAPSHPPGRRNARCSGPRFRRSA